MSAPVLVGVDVLDVDRVRRALDHDGQVYARHVTADHEHPLHQDPALAVAAAVAIKECLVKALGGRPPGFRWHDFVAVGEPGPHRDRLTALLDGAACAMARDTRVELSGFSTYELHGSCVRPARARFGLGPGGAVSGDVLGAARWGLRGPLLVAVAVLISVAKGTTR